MFEKVIYVYKNKNLTYQSTSCFGFYSKRCFPLTIVSPLVSPHITASEIHTCSLQSYQVILSSLSWNIIIPLILVNGRYTFRGRWQAEHLIKYEDYITNTGKINKENSVPISSVCWCLSSLLPTQAGQDADVSAVTHLIKPGWLREDPFLLLARPTNFSGPLPALCSRWLSVSPTLFPSPGNLPTPALPNVPLASELFWTPFAHPTPATQLPMA